MNKLASGLLQILRQHPLVKEVRVVKDVTRT